MSSSPEAPPAEPASPPVAPPRPRIWRPGPYLTCFLVAATLRMAWALYIGRTHPGIAQFPDSSSYLDPAHSLLDRGRFDAVSGRPGRPMLFRTPGYPTFIAVVQALFGRSIVPVLVVQGLVGGLVAPMVVDLSRRLGVGDRAAHGAGWVAALEPLSIVAAGFVLTETLAQATTVAAVWLVVRLVQERRWPLSLGAGTALAVTVLIRPGVYYLLPVLVVLVVWMVRHADRRWAVVAGLVLPLVVTVASWQVRNQVVADFGSFSALEHASVGLWKGVGVDRRDRGLQGGFRPLQVEAALEAARRAGSRSPDPDALLNGLAPDDVDQAAYFRELRSLGVGHIRAHPDLFIRDIVAGSAVVAVDVDETRLGLSPLTTRPAVEVVLQVGLLLLYLTALFGAIALVRRHGRELLLIAVPVAYVFATSSGPEAAGRFRLPVLPLLIPLAAASLAALRAWDRRRTPRGQTGRGPGAS